MLPIVQQHSHNQHAVQANAISGVHVPVMPSNTRAVLQIPESARFSLFSHFPVSNGGASCSGLGNLQGKTQEQSGSAGYQLFGSSNASFSTVTPLLPVSLY